VVYGRREIKVSIIVRRRKRGVDVFLLRTTPLFLALNGCSMTIEH
jgi:hypothetical protein